RSPGTYVHPLAPRLAPRRGTPRALLAVAQRLLVRLSHMLRDQVPSPDLGPDHGDRLHANAWSAEWSARMCADGRRSALSCGWRWHRNRSSRWSCSARTAQRVGGKLLLLTQVLTCAPWNFRGKRPRTSLSTLSKGARCGDYLHSCGDA